MTAAAMIEAVAHPVERKAKVEENLAAGGPFHRSQSKVGGGGSTLLETAQEYH
jgi:hypothetical protein